MKKSAKMIFVCFVMYIFCIVFGESSVAAFKNVKIGEPAPGFTLSEVGGSESVSLESYYNKNKVTIVVFWATWSPRSRKELSELRKMIKDYGDKGVDVVAVNVEKEEPTAEELAEMNKIKESIAGDFKLLLDNGLNSFREYGVVAVPSTVILDETGAIKRIFDGYASSVYMDMTAEVEIMLGIREPEVEVMVAKVEGPKINKKAKLRYGMGRKLVERGMGLKAVRELEHSARLDEKYDLPLALLGEVYEAEAERVRSKAKKGKNLDLAVDAYKRTLIRNDSNLFAYCGLARVYARQKKFDEAGEALDHAFNIDTGFITCIVSHAILLQERGDHAGAIVEFRKALELNKNLPKVHYLASKSYKSLKQYDKSVASLKESFKQLITTVQLNMAQE